MAAGIFGKIIRPKMNIKKMIHVRRQQPEATFASGKCVESVLMLCAIMNNFERTINPEPKKKEMLPQWKMQPKKKKMLPQWKMQPKIKEMM